jgi:hypothetical protein
MKEENILVLPINKKERRDIGHGTSNRKEFYGPEMKFCHVYDKINQSISRSRSRIVVYFLIKDSQFSQDQDAGIPINSFPEFSSCKVEHVHVSMWEVKKICFRSGLRKRV